MAEKKSLGFQNKDAEECSCFFAKIRSKARSKSMLCFKAFEGDENATTAGKAELYDLIIENTESQSLINTLATNFMDKGYECMVYCKGVHAAGGNKNKVKVAYAEYASKKGLGVHQNHQNPARTHGVRVRNAELPH